MDTLDEALEGIVAHEKEFPEHGVDCACMDKYIVFIRGLLTKYVPLTEDNASADTRSANFKIRWRLAHAWRVAANRL